jgi:hypothetical protein
MNRIAIAARKNHTIAFTAKPLLGTEQIGDAFAGDIAEVLVYNHELSDGERYQVENYLTRKYALEPGTLPAPSGLFAQGISPTQVSLA